MAVQGNAVGKFYDSLVVSGNRAPKNVDQRIAKLTVAESQTQQVVLPAGQQILAE